MRFSGEEGFGAAVAAAAADQSGPGQIGAL
jgi:hypothetical protein